MRKLSPLERACRAVKLAEVGLVCSTVVTCILGCVLVVTRLRDGTGFTPLAWVLTGSLATFLVTIVWHYLATDRLEQVAHTIEVTCRRAVNAGLRGDLTVAQQAWYDVEILTGKKVGQ